MYTFTLWTKPVNGIACLLARVDNGLLSIRLELLKVIYAYKTSLGGILMSFSVYEKLVMQLKRIS